MTAFVLIPHGSVDAALRSHLEPRLSPGDRERLAALAGDPVRTAAFVAGRAALLRAAARLGEPRVTIDAACPECGRSHGRPTARGSGRPLFLSLSHAAGAAFAIASRVPVGIDAESRAGLWNRASAIDDLAPGRGSAGRRWTAIEAVLKADGSGLRRAPDAVQVGRWAAILEGRRYRLRTTRTRDCLVSVATVLTG